MKQHWSKIAGKIDALSLRERAIVFALSALVLVTIINAFVLDPLFATQKALSSSLKAEQVQIADAQRQIQELVKSRATDPDAADRKRLQALLEQSAQAEASLQDIQRNLVSPDKMANLLEDILRRNGNLRLVSLKTLPPANLSGTDNDDPAAPPAAPAPQNKNLAKAAAPSAEQPAGLVYRHGVEITVQGSYLDMVNYVTALEAMPWQLFWGKAVLNAGDHTKASLSLTLFTLSLDKRWLNI